MKTTILCLLCIGLGFFLGTQSTLRKTVTNTFTVTKIVNVMLEKKRCDDVGGTFKFENYEDHIVINLNGIIPAQLHGYNISCVKNDKVFDYDLN